MSPRLRCFVSGRKTVTNVYGCQNLVLNDVFPEGYLQQSGTWSLRLPLPRVTHFGSGCLGSGAQSACRAAGLGSSLATGGQPHCNVRCLFSLQPTRKSIEQPATVVDNLMNAALLTGVTAPLLRREATPCTRLCRPTPHPPWYLPTVSRLMRSLFSSFLQLGIFSRRG